ncbi:hypothetical protein Taro_010951 [Colocasia esculenta]|uniref:C2H2-type domain-containing protein n=1 Tax=Colocasia esculenta TaxID=4460 RepID=A0A843U9P0_COLES|nr:hypothetical protein [Colocasia esculenta]
METYRADSSETLRNKCAACFRQYNKLEHLVEHMKSSHHSIHEPKCGVCDKHCRSFESLREHLIGPLPKVECAKVFSQRGCSLCLIIFDSPNSLRIHRASCQYSRTPGLASKMSNMSMCSITPENNMHVKDLRVDGRRGPQVVALACKMVGGGSDGSVDLCARLCIVDEDENVIFHTYIKPHAPVTNYRYETTGIRPEHLRDAMLLKQAQRKIQDFLCNGEPLWKIRSRGGKARILVGHGLVHDLDRLGIEYPSILIRYEIQTAGSTIQDPYEDCVAAMRLYLRMRSQAHPSYPGSDGGMQHGRNGLSGWNQKELERMTPATMLENSTSDYYCWCLDSY